MIMISLSVIIALVGRSYYVFALRGTTERITNRTKTNQGYGFYESEQQMKEEMRIFFPDLTPLLEESIVVPGLRATQALQGEFHSLSMCTTMIPQGMCITEDYIFVSAYCYSHRHNSTLYMIDRSSGKLVKTIALGGKAHVGGMAYDPIHDNIWVSGGTKGSAKAIAYTMESIEAYDISEKKPIRAMFNYTLATIDRNSYMTYDNGSLWIGYYSTGGLSQIERFDLNEEGGLNSQIVADFDSFHESVPADFIASTSNRIQGVARNDTYLYLSQSYGVSDSMLQIFQYSNSSTSFTERNANQLIRFPQKMEQICVYNNRLYCLFESGGYAYNAQPALVIDRILIFNLEDLNPEMQKAVEIG